MDCSVDFKHYKILSLVSKVMLIIMSLLYSHYTTIQICRCREIRNTEDSPLFRYKMFINFLTLVFSIRGERNNFYYADCTIWPKKRAAYPVAPRWTGPAQSRISTNVFFKITKNLSPSLPGMTSFTPQSHFLSGGFIMTFVIVISSARVREQYSMSAAPALRAE